MAPRRKQHNSAERLGIHIEAGEWCTIDAIPRPPADVYAAAGNPRLRPGRVPALGMIGAVLKAPFIPIALLLGLLAAMEDSVMRSLAPKGERTRLRAKSTDERTRRRAVADEYGLDRVFDGNWHGDAGQFLLDWYGHSPHHQRLLLATPEGIVLAAPPRRVSVGREKHMRVVARLPVTEAALVDPFAGEFATTTLLIRFRDGSWLRVETEEPRSALHMHALRRPSPDG
ncbi:MULTISPECIES: hypothetical protein [Streptomyces]|uniref:Uncharacterized protein n=1 Tax=Streptomyces hyderabadensis TaxID=598549 RepID=A0ABP9IDW4_9ACTN|nr:hypothetical protein [Streptomyces hyderabadensis]